MKKKYLALFIFSIIWFSKIFSQDVSHENLERVFRDVLIEQAEMYPSEKELFRTSIFQLDKKYENIFTFDYSQKNLFKISLENQQDFTTTAIGNGEGSGPGEFRNPTDICFMSVGKKEKVVIIDSDLARISVYNAKNGSFDNSFKTKDFVPFRLSCSNNKIILYNAGFSKKGDYAIFDINGTFQSYIKDKTSKKDSFLDDGYIAADDSLVFLASVGRPVLKKINHNERSVISSTNYVESVEVKNKTDIEKTDKTITKKRGKGFIYQARGIGVYDRYVIVLFSGRKDAYGNIIDFYSKENLEYLFSAELKGFANRLHVQGDRIITKTYDKEKRDNFFKIYKIRIAD